MVDFRYHLISLIAVILALALGILAGSGFLGGPIIEQLRSEVDDLARDNDRLRDEIGAQDVQLDEAEIFARSAQPLLVGDALAGTDIVVLQLGESSGGLVDGVKRALVDAGGTVATEITFSSKLAMQSDPAIDELALITGSLGGDPAQLLHETALLIGERIAAASADPDQIESPATSATQRLASLLADLEAAEFIGVSTEDDGRPAPEDATFVVVGGSTGRSPFDLAQFGPALAEGLTERGGRALVAESSDSTWGLVRAIRGDIEARSVTVTVDNGETTIGRIAMVLGLMRAEEGSIGHYGTQSGRTALIPDPVPSG
jgi:hypothetical protein